MRANILLVLSVLVPISYSYIVTRKAWRVGEGWRELYPGAARWVSFLLYGVGGALFYALLYTGCNWNNQAATAALVLYFVVAIVIMTYRLPS